MGAVEVFVYTRKWVGCTQTVQPRYIKDCGAQACSEPCTTLESENHNRSSLVTVYTEDCGNPGGGHAWVR